jgi:hypothetical protein
MMRESLCGDEGIARHFVCFSHHPLLGTELLFSWYMMGSLASPPPFLLLSSSAVTALLHRRARKLGDEREEEKGEAGGVMGWWAVGFCNLFARHITSLVRYWTGKGRFSFFSS